MEEVMLSWSGIGATYKYNGVIWHIEHFLVFVYNINSSLPHCHLFQKMPFVRKNLILFTFNPPTWKNTIWPLPSSGDSSRKLNIGRACTHKTIPSAPCSDAMFFLPLGLRWREYLRTYIAPEGHPDIFYLINLPNEYEGFH